MCSATKRNGENIQVRSLREKEKKWWSTLVYNESFVGNSSKKQCQKSLWENRSGFFAIKFELRISLFYKIMNSWFLTDHTDQILIGDEMEYRHLLMTIFHFLKWFPKFAL